MGPNENKAGWKSDVRMSHEPLRNIGRVMIRQLIPQHFRNSDIMATCVTCRNFDAPRYYCKLYNAIVPPDVIANSCIVGYDDHDEIPFHR
jgi:hypothetical protein